MKQTILHVVKYFDTYAYPPTIEEIYQFSPVKAGIEVIRSTIHQLVNEGELVQEKNRVAFSPDVLVSYRRHYFISKKDLSQLDKLKPVFSLIPTLKFMGVSGSLSMNDSGVDDDIDLFIIASDGTLWFTRFIVLTIKKLSAFFGFYIGKKLCFNLFFSQSSLVLASKKQSEYTAHEVLQVKPFIDKEKIYGYFLYSNNWVQQFCPNVHINPPSGAVNNKLMKKRRKALLVETILRKIQEWWLVRKGIKFCQKNGQLWLIQNI